MLTVSPFLPEPWGRSADRAGPWLAGALDSGPCLRLKRPRGPPDADALSGCLLRAAWLACLAVGLALSLETRAAQADITSSSAWGREHLPCPSQFCASVSPSARGAGDRDGQDTQPALNPRAESVRQGLMGSGQSSVPLCGPRGLLPAVPGIPDPARLTGMALFASCFSDAMEMRAGSPLGPGPGRALRFLHSSTVQVTVGRSPSVLGSFSLK